MGIHPGTIGKIDFFEEFLCKQTSVRDEHSLTMEKNRILYSLQKEIGHLQNQSVLDISSGIGEWALFFARQGCCLTFLHPSSQVLQKTQEFTLRFDPLFQIQWVQAHFQNFRFSSLFDILHFREGTFESFSEEEQKHALEFLYHALKPQGLFVFEFMNRDFFLDEVPKKIYFEESGKARLEQMDFCYSSSHLFIKRQTFGLGGQGVEEEMRTFRLYSLHEIISLLKEAGFSQFVFLDGNGTPFLSRVSPQFLIFGSKEAG